ncbi:ABC exporter membrane fusion protein, DevB family [Thalassoporum mexicanum PCC 7367]|nr:ABC exporter membrane fusion protein, DevB family [Pseudanabaena sp. PCC 7367]
MTIGDRGQQGGNSRTVIIAGVVIAIGLLGFGASRLIATNQRQQAEQQAAIEAEQAQTVRDSVAALGRVEPQGEVILVSGPAGERLAILEVDRGDFVTAGQPIAYLETYAETLAQRDLEASRLAEAEKRLLAITINRESQIEEAQANLISADLPKEYEIAAQKAEIRRLEAQLELDQADLRRSQSLQADGAISQQELDRQETAAAQTAEQLDNARQILTQLESNRSTQVQLAQAQLLVQQTSLPLDQVQVAVESARQALALAEAQLERTIIRAKKDGQILRVITREGEAIASDGGIVEMGNTTQMFVVAEVYETDVGLVEIGQPAKINSRNGAFEQELSGTVSEVGWVIFKNDVLDDDPAANADARVVEVRIKLDPADSEVVAALTNLQVDVRIDVEASRNEG